MKSALLNALYASLPSIGAQMRSGLRPSPHHAYFLIRLLWDHSLIVRLLCRVPDSSAFCIWFVSHTCFVFLRGCTCKTMRYIHRSIKVRFLSFPFRGNPPCQGASCGPIPILFMNLDLFANRHYAFFKIMHTFLCPPFFQSSFWCFSEQYLSGRKSATQSYESAHKHGGKAGGRN